MEISHAGPCNGKPVTTSLPTTPIHARGSRPSPAPVSYTHLFTRAMNTESVLSFGTLKNARIESDYNLLVQALEERDAANALRSMSTGDDDEEIFDDGSIDDAVVLSDELPEPPARYDASDDDDASHISGVVTG